MSGRFWLAIVGLGISALIMLSYDAGLTFVVIIGIAFGAAFE